MALSIPSTLLMLLLDKSIAVAFGISAATVGLLLKGGYYAGKRVIYGRELTTDEKVLEQLKQLKHIANTLEKRERALEEQEIKLEQAITDLVHPEYKGNSKN